MLTEFLDGATYVTKGCRSFYKDRKAWRYAIVPIVIMAVLYALFFGIVLYFTGIWADHINEWLSGLPAWLSWITSAICGLSYVLSFAIAVLVLGTTICSFYEMFGGFFFDSLVEYYEQKKYGIVPGNHSVMDNVKICVDSILFGIRTSALFIFLLLLGLFFPIIGQILLIVFMGYYMGITYLICSANNSGVSIPKIQSIVKKRIATILGFGVTAYVLLLIPFATIIILPGLVLGGSDLFNNELREGV